MSSIIFTVSGLTAILFIYVTYRDRKKPPHIIELQFCAKYLRHLRNAEDAFREHWVWKTTRLQDYQEYEKREQIVVDLQAARMRLQKYAEEIVAHHGGYNVLWGER